MYICIYVCINTNIYIYIYITHTYIHIRKMLKGLTRQIIFTKLSKKYLINMTEKLTLSEVGVIYSFDNDDSLGICCIYEHICMKLYVFFCTNRFRFILACKKIFK